MFPASPTYVEAEEIEPLIHATCINVMSKMLDLPSELCQLTALHGLNHWHELFPNEVERIVDTFLDRRDDVTPRVREYAADARAGRCQ